MFVCECVGGRARWVGGWIHTQKTDNPDNEELQCTFEEVVALRKLGSVYHDQGMCVVKPLCAFVWVGG